MVLNDDKRAVGVFSSRQKAEYALNELKASGFPMDKVSIIATGNSGESACNSLRHSPVCCL